MTTHRPTRRALALDFGRVLTLDPDKSVFTALLTPYCISETLFSQAWGVPRHDYDKGTLDTPSYWNQVLKLCSPSLTDHDAQALIPELIDADYQSWAQPRTSLHRVIEKALDVKIPTAIVSNMPQGLGERFVKTWPWLKRIPYRFFSADIGLVKPDDAFYHYVLERTGWSAADVLFVDDLAVNVESAARFGFETLLFTGTKKDVERISQWYQE